MTAKPTYVTRRISELRRCQPGSMGAEIAAFYDNACAQFGQVAAEALTAHCIEALDQARSKTFAGFLQTVES